MERSEPGPSAVLPFHHVLLTFTAYYMLEGVLKLLCRHLSPEFYAKLKSEERYLPFFGFIMGWLITLFSTPICLYAFITDDHTKGEIQACTAPCLKRSTKATPRDIQYHPRGSSLHCISFRPLGLRAQPSGVCLRIHQTSPGRPGTGERAPAQ